MDIFSKLKLDSWWNLILYLGILFGAASLILEIDFLENKHLFGLALGMILFSLSFWIAEKKLSTIKPPDAYTGPTALISWKEIHHNFFSLLLLIISIILICVFGLKIISGLI